MELPNEAYLSEKQKRFCEEYVIDLNAAAAAVRAGYTTKTARNSGYRLLQNPDVEEYIKQLQDKISCRLVLDAETVLKEIAYVAMASMGDFTEDNWQLKKVSTIPKNKMAAVETITITETEVKGERKVTTVLKLRDKMEALGRLSSFLKVYNLNLQKIRLETS